MRKAFLLLAILATSACSSLDSSGPVSSAAVSIGDAWTEISLDRPLRALHRNAYVDLDVSAVVPSVNAPQEFEKFYDTMKSRFPAGCIQGLLIDADGKEYRIENEPAGVSSFTASENFVSVHSTSGLPTNTRFTKLKLRASCALSNARVFWAAFRW